MLAGVKLRRRSITDVKLEILRYLLEHRRSALKSKYLGSLIDSVQTDYYSFWRAIRDLERRGLVKLGKERLGKYEAVIVEITPRGEEVARVAVKLV